MTEDLKVLT